MHRRVAIGAVVMLAGCHAGSASAPPSSPAGRFTIVERAESSPVTALAVSGPYLWAGGGAGLRRIERKSGEYEIVGGPGVPGGHDVAALSVDEQGGVWVSTPAEVGRWVMTGGSPRFEGHGAPGPVTVLAAGRPFARAGVWAGGPKGLYWFDGHGWVTIVSLREVAVTSLALDESGGAVWVGTAARGVFRAEGEGATPVTSGQAAGAGGEEIVLDTVVGSARPASGTRLYAGAARGEARLYAQTRAGIEGYRAPRGVHITGLCERAGEAVLLVGPSRAEAQPHRLQYFGPGQSPPSGSLRFTPLMIERAGRWAAIPLAERVPPEVTAVVAADEDLYVGTAHMGIARAAAGTPELLDGSALVGDAEHLSVACVAAAHCYVVTDGPRARETNGDSYRPATVGEPPGATALALAKDAQGAVYALSVTTAKTTTLAISLYVAAGPGGREDWRVLHRIPLTLPPGTTPVASFAAVSPTGTLWLGLRAAASGGDEVGYGAVEIDLGTGRAVQHRPHAAGEAIAPEALPLPANLTGVLFDGAATWFSSLSGVTRWQEGQLRSWTENDGLPSESVHGVARGPDRLIWVATTEGLARYDGRDWRALGAHGEGPELTTRGLATDGKGRVWVASSKGLRLLVQPATDPGSAPVVLPGNMRDVAVDRFGRVWAMSNASIAVIEEK
jgi:ligand-binding sensor domain-containing protein